MRALFLVAPVSLLAAGAVLAQQPATDSVIKDGDPVMVGNPANPTQGPDSPAEAPSPAPLSSNSPSAPSATPPPVAPATDTTTRLYAAAGPGGTQVTANAPIPDTPENRAKYGQPLSRAGKRTAAAGD